MPELPEVESIVRMLRRDLVGARVTHASLRHAEMLVAHAAGRTAARPVAPGSRQASTLLLAGAEISAIHRRGKSFALEVDDGRALALHLGMSGRLLLIPAERSASLRRLPHVHARWSLTRNERSWTLLFVDPRRFGGMAAYPSFDLLRSVAWRRLGPDALDMKAAELAHACSRSMRPIKSLLLDQSVIAGIGNIYADEILHGAGVHPLTPAARAVAGSADAQRIAAITRRILERAVELGGSTIRDYIDPSGRFGRAQTEHRVYGRAGQPCTRRRSHADPDSTADQMGSPICPGTITTIKVHGRTTAFCPRCQVQGRSRIGLIHKP